LSDEVIVGAEGDFAHNYLIIFELD
jgi:hypothetical protein